MPQPAPGTRDTPLPESVEKAYRRKCVELKKRLSEVEDSNDSMRQRRSRLNRAILKMRLERAILLEQLSKSMEFNYDESDKDTSPPQTVYTSSHNQPPLTPQMFPSSILPAQTFPQYGSTNLQVPYAAPQVSLPNQGSTLRPVGIQIAMENNAVLGGVKNTVARSQPSRQISFMPTLSQKDYILTDVSKPQDKPSRNKRGTRKSSPPANGSEVQMSHSPQRDAASVTGDHMTPQNISFHHEHPNGAGSHRSHPLSNMRGPPQADDDDDEPMQTYEPTPRDYDQSQPSHSAVGEGLRDRHDDANGDSRAESSMGGSSHGFHALNR